MPDPHSRHPGDKSRHNATEPTFNAWEDDELEYPELPDAFPWIYVTFVYLFSCLAIYLLVKDTQKVIRIRQGYLGSLSSVTDRTLRLSGIPHEMRSEEKIKAFIEELQIGNVDSVMLCREWQQLDKLVSQRAACLRRLEEAWTRYLNQRRRTHGSHSKSLSRDPSLEPNVNGHEREDASLLTPPENHDQRPHQYNHDRPQKRVWYGSWGLQSRKVDAIHYYEERLRQKDEAIEKARGTAYSPTPLAYVTMESTAACQMAVQARLDPHPGQCLTSLAAPPADVIWENTYLSRRSRMSRSWTIMIVVGFLTIFWIFLILPFAALLEIENIRALLPGLANVLDDHDSLGYLVSTSLPTLGLSLLSILVPYLYDWLSHMQGMTSQGDIELSLISKNFFFTFFNLFIVFTVFGTAATFSKFQNNLRDILKDTSTLAYTIARSLEGLTSFYIDLIILQGIGLFPFRLLEFGTVAMYPVWMIWAKTPRDHAELVQPPVFNYGYYAPQTILVFIICIVYSVLDQSWLVQLAGLLFFLIGSFVYKYQLLYAMDHREHSTGRAWPMICNRIFVGLLVFQLAMAGWLALRKAFFCALLIVPLLVGTVWFDIYFQRTYDPLMKFIALRSIGSQDMVSIPPLPQSRWDAETDQGRTVDTDPVTGVRYINPNLVAPLEKPWIEDDQLEDNAG